MLTLSSGFTMAASGAETAGGGTAGQGSAGSTSLQNVKEILATRKYGEYMRLYGNTPEATDVVKVDMTDFDEGETTENYAEILSEYNGKSGALLKTGASGKVTLNINVPKTALYAIRLNYCATSDRAMSVERTFYINGKVPFAEARYLRLKKTWYNEYEDVAEGERPFRKDLAGNEVRPDINAIDTWQQYVFADPDGLYTEPFLFYFEEGENTVTIESVREEVVLADMELYPYEAPKTYEEVKKEYEQKGYAPTDEVIHIDAETPSATSDYQIYPTTDKISVKTEPQNATYTVMNIIGNGYWSDPGMWVEYQFDVEKAGLYTFMFRYKQDYKGGMYTSRALYIDGELPYAEAGALQFDYGDEWQTKNATDGEQELQFYLSEGSHTIRLEITIGKMAEVLRRLSAVQTAINDDYLSIVRLTGAVPDEYRDYGFSRVMPDVIRDLKAQSDELYDVVKYMEEVGGGRSENTTTIEQIAEILNRMGTDERQVAKNLEQLKTYLGTLSSWISSMRSQGLDIDYINVQSIDGDIPKAEANFFARLWYEIKKFFASFFVDYNALSVTENDTETNGELEVWTSAGRDQSQIIKNIIDNRFSVDYKTAVTMKIVDNNTLLPAILANIGPDVALDGITTTNGAISTNTATTSSAGSINDYAIRGAVLPVSQREGFDELVDQIVPTAFEAVTLSAPDENGKYVDKSYGIPVKAEWPMMFYRKDILAQLDMEIPQTWDDLLSLVPVLQFSNMEICMTADMATFGSITYQRGGDFWADDGMRVNFDSNVALESFEIMMNMFTQYSLPLVADASNRFRTGETPIVLGQYMTNYNQFQVFSSEIAGLWSFDLIPGTMKDDGTIDRSIIGSADAVCMLRGCRNEDMAWEFMKWYAGKEFQIDYFNEYAALIGEGAKGNPANVEAIEELTWTNEEYEKLMEQAKWVKVLRQNPGSYFLTRNVNFAINNTYNNRQDPAETMLGYINEINKEISRKREEFGLETLEIGQTLAEKRLGQASEKLDELADDGDTIKAVREAMDKADTDSITSTEIDKLREAIESLRRMDGDKFREVIQFLEDAADALETYI